ncbi:hypothetical protein UA08_02785 [Talaromyces atroroseus]|uniref:Protein FAF1 n=1 Tax=Talaromyces atroroseus TaxID=1441469 RepID=A0A225AML0_TALAT|nr:hypothetical protein UA08_02785 [Talaromyces atroroseus]OKL62130.1 hypothetical protein UA08_02785 [Talaromyces atroroseus]
MGPTAVKRRKISQSSMQATNSTTELEEHPNDVFRKFFESQFRPLDDTHIHKKRAAVAVTSQESEISDDEADQSGEENFEGFSDIEEDEEEEEQEVMVVEHVDVRNENVLLDKQTRKALLSAKVPASSDTLNSTSKKSNKAKDEEVDNEAANLQNDLALQRLLKESHLLDSTSSDLNPTGKNRHKALDLRLQALGAKKSLFERNKMPKSHRQGIEARAVKTETTRRREARENGIILEKPVFKQQKNSSSSAKRRDRGVGAPAVGKFAGGTLRLSKHDLASIQGPSRKGGKGSKRGRR